MRKRDRLVPLPKSGDKMARRFMKSIISPETINWVNKRTFGVLASDRAPTRSPSFSRNIARASRKIGIRPTSIGVMTPLRAPASKPQEEVEEDKSYMEKSYNYNQNDIVQRREIPLFKIISARYLKTLKRLEE